MASYRVTRTVTYDDIPDEVKAVIISFVSFTNESLRTAIKEWCVDKAAVLLPPVAGLATTKRAAAILLL